jgi:hypothetical protein
VEVPPHYDSFAEFTYSYHHGDVYVPYIKQDEPLKMEMRHYIECIKEGIQPITGGPEGMEVVRILEASNVSLRERGASISLVQPRLVGGENSSTPVNGNNNGAEVAATAASPAGQKLVSA